MRYRFDWSCKEWLDFSERAEVEHVDRMVWWEEYCKYHRFYVSYAEFLDKVEDILKAIFHDDIASIEEAFGAIALLRKGKLKRIQFDDLELSVWEDAK